MVEKNSVNKTDSWLPDQTDSYDVVEEEMSQVCLSVANPRPHSKLGYQLKIT